MPISARGRTILGLVVAAAVIAAASGNAAAGGHVTVRVVVFGLAVLLAAPALLGTVRAIRRALRMRKARRAARESESMWLLVVAHVLIVVAVVGASAFAAHVGSTTPATQGAITTEPAYSGAPPSAPLGNSGTVDCTGAQLHGTVTPNGSPVISDTVTVRNVSTTACSVGDAPSVVVLPQHLVAESAVDALPFTDTTFTLRPGESASIGLSDVAKCTSIGDHSASAQLWLVLWVGDEKHVRIGPISAASFGLDLNCLDAGPLTLTH